MCPRRSGGSPAKAAAIAGGAAFFALGGPKRAFRAGKRAITGEPAPMPRSMLPKEVEKTLRKLGDDGDEVRAALERDFADYAKQAERDRVKVPTMLPGGVRPADPVPGGEAGDSMAFPDR